MTAGEDDERSVAGRHGTLGLGFEVSVRDGEDGIVDRLLDGIDR
ncbi:MAG TPA: hypothetical protein VF115_07530 [Acidimicrobiia bacterium]